MNTLCLWVSAKNIQKKPTFRRNTLCKLLSNSEFILSGVCLNKCMLTVCLLFFVYKGMEIIFAQCKPLGIWTKFSGSTLMSIWLVVNWQTSEEKLIPFIISHLVYIITKETKLCLLYCFHSFVFKQWWISHFALMMKNCLLFDLFTNIFLWMGYFSGDNNCCYRGFCPGTVCYPFLCYVFHLWVRNQGITSVMSLFLVLYYYLVGIPVRQVCRGYQETCPSHLSLVTQWFHILGH